MITQLKTENTCEENAPDRILFDFRYIYFFKKVLLNIGVQKHLFRTKINLKKSKTKKKESFRFFC